MLSSLALEKWKWNERGEFLVRPVSNLFTKLFSPHREKSLIFSPTSWVPVCGALCTLHCNSIKANRAGPWLSASSGIRKWEWVRGREVGARRSLDSRTLSHNVYIQGNNTFRTARLQQGGVAMIYHPVVQIAAGYTHTHPHSPPAPLTLRPGYISLTQLRVCAMWASTPEEIGSDFQVTHPPKRFDSNDSSVVWRSVFHRAEEQVLFPEGSVITSRHL